MKKDQPGVMTDELNSKSINGASDSLTYEADTDDIDLSVIETLENAGPDLPESLSVENMMAKIAQMSPEEIAARRQSVDLPEQDMPADRQEDENADPMGKAKVLMIKDADRSKNDSNVNIPAAASIPSGADGRIKGKVSFFRRYRRYVTPLATAAALLIVVGIGMFAGKNGMFKRNESAGMSESASLDMAASDMADSEAAYEESAYDSIDGEMNNVSKAAGRDATMDAAASESDEADDYGYASGEQYADAYAYFEKMQSLSQVMYESVNGDMAVEDEAAEEREVLPNLAPADETPDSSHNFKADSEAVSGAISEQAGLAIGSDDDKAAERGVDFTDTNVRTQGVLQGDIVKTDGRYIYVYDERTEHIRIYEAKDGKTSETGNVSLVSELTRGSEMYIAGDTLVFMGEGKDAQNAENRTMILLYDISDPYSPVLKQSLSQDGLLYSSRLTDGYLYTFSKKYFPFENMNREDPRTYVPAVEQELIRPDDIYIPEETMQTEYVVISSLDIGGEQFTDKKAILAGADLLYVSDDQIYLADEIFDWNTFMPQNETQILRFSYHSGVICEEAKGSVPGYVKDDYCMDERNNKLRLVTTYTEDYESYNALYVLDEDLQKIGVIKKIAQGETIKSARFMGDTAYFVTFRTTDPLFAVDLSDDTDPRIIGYLKLPGFSAYLHPLDDDFMLGIGYHTDRNGWPEGVKVSTYYVADPANIQETDSIELSLRDAVVLENPKALYFDPEKKLFGFAGYTNDTKSDENDGKDVYLVFSYEDPVCISSEMTYEMGESGGQIAQDTRGLRIGDHLYVVAAGYGISSFEADGMKSVEEGIRVAQ